MLPTIDSNPELFSFWGEIRKGQEMVQGLKAQVDALLLLHEYQPQDKRIIQRLAKRSDQIQEAFAHALEQKETILQRLLFVRVFLPQLDQMGIHALIEAMGKALWWGAIPQPEPITKVTAKRHSDELEAVLQAFRVVQGFEVAQAPIDQEPTPTAPIVSPAAQATEPADSKPTEPKPKAKGTGLKGRPPAFTMAEGIQALKEDRTRLGWSGEEWGRHFDCSKSTVIASDFWKSLRPLKCQSRMEKAPPNKSADRIS